MMLQIYLMNDFMIIRFFSHFNRIYTMNLIRILAEWLLTMAEYPLDATKSFILRYAKLQKDSVAFHVFYDSLLKSL